MILLLSWVLVMFPFIVNTAYMTWNPPNDGRSNLYCHDVCLDNGGDMNHECCYCNSISSWEFDGENSTLLFLEYSNLFGTNILFLQIQHENTTKKLYRAVHRNGYMSTLPQNLCEFPEIIELDFSNNFIRKISNISCLVNIEKLLLPSNRITHLFNTTFTNNTMLKEIDISKNLITVLDPNTFVVNGLTVFRVDVSQNKLKALDITNIIFENGYCSVSYDDSPIQEIINQNNFHIDTNKTYGGHGDILLRNSSITSFINLTEIGIMHPKEILKFLEFSIETGSTNMECNCLIEPLLEGQGDALQRFVPALPDNVCSGPGKLKGVSYKSVLQDPDLLDLFVCEKKFKCPLNCKCFDQPSQNHLLVNCTNANLTGLPTTLPFAKNYSLLLGDNAIEKLEYQDYLERVSVLEISNNPLTTIPESVVQKLPNTLKLTALGNNLKNIPKSFQLKTSSALIFGDVSIDCTCDDIWIKDWLNIGRSIENTTILCKNMNSLDIKIMDETNLKCQLYDSYHTIMIISLTLLCFSLIIALLLFTFCRTELFIIYREKLRRRKRHQNEMRYDVTISMNVDDRFQMLWVRYILTPFLQQNNYSVYIPIRDEPLGMSKEDCLQYQVNNSRGFIIILSKGSFSDKIQIMADDQDTDTWKCTSQAFQFARMWKTYKKDKSRRIVIVNFDNMKVAQIMERNVKAFMRVREVLKFTDRHGNILHKIKTKLGEPNSTNTLNDNCLSIHDL